MKTYIVANHNGVKYAGNSLKAANKIAYEQHILLVEVWVKGCYSSCFQPVEP